jgi:hypothetical protein
MICLKCGGNTECVDSRDHGDYIRRRRKCKICGFRYTSKERVLLELEERQSLFLDENIKNYVELMNRWVFNQEDLRDFGIQLLKAADIAMYYGAHADHSMAKMTLRMMDTVMKNFAVGRVSEPVDRENEGTCQ